MVAKFHGFSKRLAVSLAACVCILTAPVEGQIAETPPPPQLPSQRDVKLETHPLPLTLKKYMQTPTFAKRQQTYAKNWTNPEKDLRYGDQSVLRIKMVKNPSVSASNGITSKSRRLSAGPEPGKPNMTCVTDAVSLTATSDSFLNSDYSSTNSHIYPGAIFTFDNFYSGDYLEQRGKRNSLTLSTDNSNINGSSGVIVQDPDVVSLRDAANTLKHRATGRAANESSDIQIVQSSTSSQLNMQIGGGASAFGISLSDAFTSNQGSNTINLTVDGRKSVFSISVVPPDNGFFTDSGVESTPNLMVVGSVSYGVRVLANVSITFNSSTEANEFKASYNGIAYNANAVFNYLNSHSNASTSVNAFVIGGAGNSIVTFSPKHLLEQVNAILDGVSYDNAQPIEYQFFDMAGDVIGAQSATDFNERQCVPANRDKIVKSIRVEFLSGRDGKDADTNLNVFLFPPDYSGSNLDDQPQSSYGYQSQGHSTAFGANQSTDIVLTSGNGATNNIGLELPESILDRGGHLHIHIYPNGNDTWYVSNVNLYFNMDDGTVIKFPVSPSNFVVSQTVRTYDLYYPAGSLSQNQ